MRILLIQHSRENDAFYPLGLGYIAAVLLAAGHRVTFLDLALEKGDPFELARRRIQADGAIAVGMSTITAQYPEALSLARRIRAAGGIRLVMGGHHPSCYPEEVLRDGGADVVAIGEGEMTAPALVQVLEDGGDPSTVAGIGHLASDGTYLQTPPGERPADLDRIPFPPWALLRPERYTGRLRGRKCAALITSRGCPYRCVHCNRGPSGGPPVRRRSPRNVLDEIETLYRFHGIRAFRIKDDQFTLGRDHTREFCRELIRTGIPVLWDCQTRVDHIDAQTLVLMKRAGCVCVDFGVESGSRDILNKLGKMTSPEAIRRAFAVCREAGMPTRAFFIAGTPWETRQTLRETIALAQDLQATTTVFFLATPYPGTALRQAFIRHHWPLPRNYDQYRQYGRTPSGRTLSDYPPPDHPQACFETQRLRATRVVALSQVIRFWNYPRLLKDRLRIHSPRELGRQAFRGLRHLL